MSAGREQRIRDSLLTLFGAEALSQGILAPVGGGQTETWLRFVVPEIEGAYGVQVYAPQEESLRRAIEEITRIFEQFGESPARTIDYILTGTRAEPGTK